MTAIDLFAEIVVAACAAASAEGACLAHERVTRGDFSSGTCAAIFEAAADLPEAPMPAGEQQVSWTRARVLGEPAPLVWPSDIRTATIAQRLNIPSDELAEFIARRSVHADTAGHYARRVHAAARHRRLREQAVNLHELLAGDDADFERAASTAAELATQLQETC